MANAKFIDAATWAALPEIDVTNSEDLFPQLGAGTFRPVLSGVASVVIPALTAGSIVEVSPTVGDTLTVSGSNATGTATFQWQVDTGGGYGNVSGATSATLDTTGEPAGDYRRGVTDGVQGPVYTAGVTVAAADETAPVLSSPTGAANGSTGATSLGVTTDEGNGTLYWGIYPSASTPSAADIVAGTGATVSGSQAVSGTGAQVVADQTGLTAETGYKARYVHDDASTNRSNAVATATFTTAAVSASAPAVVGYNEVTPTLFSNEITVPLPAGTVAGQPVIILLTGSWTPASPTTPTDWTALPVQVVFNSASTTGCWVIPYYRNAVTSGEVSSGVTIALGANNDVSAVSVSLDSGTIGASGKTADDLGIITSLAAPTIAVDEGSTTIVFYVFSQRSITAPSPAADYFHMPDSKSSSKTIAVYAFEDEAGPNNTALTATFPGTRAGAYSIEVEAA